MYRDITILIASGDNDMAQQIDSVLAPYRFNVRHASGLMPAMRLVEGSDLLFLDWDLPDEQAEALLTCWLRTLSSGPACVIESGLSAKERNDLMRKTWCILTKPVDPEDVAPVAERFAMTMRGLRAMVEIQKLRRWVIGLTIVVAALGGVEIVLPIVRALIGG